jgi:hypothetical protein
MKQARTLLLVLSGIFLITEMVFNFIVLTKEGGDLFGTFVKTSLLLVFILLYSKKLKWARWILSITLVLYGLLCLVAGLESGPIFYAIGLYDIFFGIYLHKSHALTVFRHPNNGAIEHVSNSNENSETFAVNRRVYHYPTLVTRYQALFIDLV